MTFADMNLDPRVVEALRRMDVVDPTPIQEAAIPGLMEGRDVAGQARTGSGKTIAFALPVLSRCDPSIGAAQALILVPTRELAGQVARVIDLLAPSFGLRVAQIYGGRDMADQIQLLNTGPQIIIGTPGRVLDHLYRGTLLLRDLRILVLDEADQMLDAGFGPDVDRILDCMTRSPQMALFSATMPAWVHDVVHQRLQNPAIINVEEGRTGPVETVEHTVIEVPQNRKLDALQSLLDEQGNGTVVIFARTKIGVEKLERQLQNLGYRAAALQGNMTQGNRERVLRGFRRGNPPILVATNVAARGLDILSIEQVINYDVPENAEALTHRLGRTGRMGRHGTAVTLIGPADTGKWKAIERELGVRTRRERFGEERQAEQPMDRREERPAAQPVERSADRPAAQPMERSADRRSPPRRDRGPRGNTARTKTAVTCANCGQETTVPFTPRNDRPVYCNACYKDRKESAA